MPTRCNQGQKTKKLSPRVLRKSPFGDPSLHFSISFVVYIIIYSMIIIRMEGCGAITSSIWPLGIRDSRKTNFAFLAKQGWNILKHQNCLWVEIMQRKYLKYEDFLSVNAKSTDFHTWRSILKGRSVLAKGLGRCVRSGRKTLFWLDSWLPCGPLIMHAKYDIEENEVERPLADYYTGNGNWKWEDLSAYLPDEVLEMLAALWLDPSLDEDDEVCWKLTADGSFSIKSAYDSQLQDYQGDSRIWRVIWQLKCPSKMLIFLWKIMYEALPTWRFFERRNLMDTSLCFRCGRAVEDILHALRDCASSRKVWLSFDIPLRYNSFFSNSLHDWLIENLMARDTLCNVPWSIVFSFAIWMIWFWLNSMLHVNDFTWPLNTSAVIMGGAKEAWDVLSSLHNRLKRLTLIGWRPPCQSKSFFQLPR